MAFSGKYPEQIEFEIDRKKLVRYWRLQGLLGYTTATIVAGLLMAVATFADHVRGQFHLHVNELLLILVLHLAVGLAIGLLFGLVFYYLACHHSSKWRAQNLRLIVEGPYLRLISGAIFVTDRRMHFRAITDYSTSHGPLLRWLGMKNLSFRVVGYTQSFSTTVAGLVDPDKVRDMLCEIDAAREN